MINKSISIVGGFVKLRRAWVVVYIFAFLSFQYVLFKACFFIFLPLDSIIIKNWKLGNYGAKKEIKKIKQTLAQNFKKRYHRL